MPNTHQEIARAIGLLLEEKTDIHATGQTHDSFMGIDGIGQIVTGMQPSGDAAGGNPTKIKIEHLISEQRAQQRHSLEDQSGLCRK